VVLTLRVHVVWLELTALILGDDAWEHAVACQILTLADGDSDGVALDKRRGGSGGEADRADDAEERKHVENFGLVK
jgi:hypothetical protein